MKDCLKSIIVILIILEQILRINSSDLKLNKDTKIHLRKIPRKVGFCEARSGCCGDKSINKKLTFEGFKAQKKDDIKKDKWMHFLFGKIKKVIPIDYSDLYKNAMFYYNKNLKICFLLFNKNVYKAINDWKEYVVKLSNTNYYIYTPHIKKQDDLENIMVKPSDEKKNEYIISGISDTEYSKITSRKIVKNMNIKDTETADSKNEDEHSCGSMNNEYNNLKIFDKNEIEINLSFRSAPEISFK